MQREADEIQDIVRKLMYEAEELERDIEELVEKETDASEYSRWERGLREIKKKP